MRELGLPPARIRLMMTATDKVPNTSATAASSGADLNGVAVQDACRQLRARLLPFAAAMLKERFGDDTVTEEQVRFENGAVFVADKTDEIVEYLEVVDRAYMERVSLSAQGYYKTPGMQWDRAKGQGRPFHYFACGAAVTEVEVDGYDGHAAGAPRGHPPRRGPLAESRRGPRPDRGRLRARHGLADVRGFALGRAGASASRTARAPTRSPPSATRRRISG